MKPNGQGLKRIYRATKCSVQGLSAAIKHESAFRQELLLCLVLIPIAILTADTLWRFAGLISCLLILLIVEILNSAIEATVDRIGLEHHELAGRAKDMGSAAVTLAILLVGVVWAAHLYEYFISMN